MAFRVYGQAATVAMLLGYATYAGHGPFAVINNKIRGVFGYPPIEVHNTGIIKND
jgi:tryptophanase